MPTTRAAKRKAEGEAPPPPSSSSSNSAKKPKVALHTTQATVTSSASEKTQLRHSSVEVEIPVSTLATGKPIVFDNDYNNHNNKDDDVVDNDAKGPGEPFTPQEGLDHDPLEAQLSSNAAVVVEAAKGEEEVDEDGEKEDSDAEAPGESFTPQEGLDQDPLEAQLSSKVAVVEGAAGGEEVDEDREEEDSDDEAPEAVSTSTAAAQAARSAQAAASAADRQYEERKRKRQERDAKFKAQAEVRKKKEQQQQQQQQQQATTKAAEEEAAAAAGKQEQQPEARLPGITTSTSDRKRRDKRSLPSMLPEEYLVSDSESSDDEDLESGRKPKKIKFNTAAQQVARSESRHPVDLHVGTTVYRVMKKAGDGKLAPTSGKYSKHAKELLLGRGRIAPRTGAGAKKKGFLVKR